MNNPWVYAIPATAEERRRITHLELNRQGLTEIPEELWECTALTCLYLGHNNLTTLPVEIGRLSTLTRLDLGNNKLVTLPPEVGRLSTLTRLYLRRNSVGRGVRHGEVATGGTRQLCRLRVVEPRRQAAGLVILRRDHSAVERSHWRTGGMAQGSQETGEFRFVAPQRSVAGLCLIQRRCYPLGHPLLYA